MKALVWKNGFELLWYISSSWSGFVGPLSFAAPDVTNTSPVDQVNRQRNPHEFHPERPNFSGRRTWPSSEACYNRIQLLWPVGNSLYIL